MYIPILFITTIPLFTIGFIKTNTRIIKNTHLPFSPKDDFNDITTKHKTFFPFTKTATTPLETIKNIISFPGLTVGVPFTMMSSYYTYQHYGYNIMSPKIILLQFLMGFYVYGGDRLNDAIEYEMKPYETNKSQLYKFLLKDKKTYKELFSQIFIIILIIFFDNGASSNILDAFLCMIFYEVSKAYIFSYFQHSIEDNKEIIISSIFPISILITSLYELNTMQFLPFIILLETTNYYKSLKKNYGFLKPFYVAVLWVICSVVLPCVIHDNGYYILHTPSLHIEEYLSPFFLIFGLTNMADIKDIEDDKENNIYTFPVLIGDKLSIIMSMTSLYLFYYYLK